MKARSARTTACIATTTILPARLLVTGLALLLSASSQIACGSFDPVAEGGGEHAGTVAATPVTAEPQPSPQRLGRGALSSEVIISGNGARTQDFAVGGTHACKLSSGAVKCWGYNYFGQLGLGDSINRGDKANDMGGALGAVDLGGHLAKAIAAGENHTCAILDNGSVVCWGENSYGQLGRGDDTPNWGTSPLQMGGGLVAVNLGVGVTAKALALGTNHSCAVLSDDALKCWGDNRHGQLGLGDTLNRGRNPAQMGDALARVSLGAGKSVKAVATGGLHTCAILDDESLKCWGYNAYGQLGYGDTADRGTHALFMGDGLPAVSLGSSVLRVLQISTSPYGTCAILGTTTTPILKCWGDNLLGQLGTGDRLNRGDTIATTGDGLPAVALGASAAPILVATGWDHTCATLADGAVKCWGTNDVGQLGHGDKQSRGMAPGEMGDGLAPTLLGAGVHVNQLQVGISHSCALLDTGVVKCWGYNAGGQLGQNSFEDLGDQGGEMGDALPALDLGP